MSGIESMLPRDGSLTYIRLLDEVQRVGLFRKLSDSVEWKHDEVIMFGKKIITKRKMAWYGDPGKDYRYSGITRKALPWNDALLVVKERVEQASGSSFNSCLCNLYHDGSEGMGWHRDNEPELKPDAIIGSLSLGRSRKFEFRHRMTGEKYSLELEDGSLLLMHPPIQEYWDHRLPAMARVQGPRINLTFRTIL
jgi:alkylated DNA repair dioxygenase AlkB